VFVRLQPGKEETFFSASRSRIFCFFHVVDVRSVVQTMKGSGGKGQGKPGRGKGKGKGKGKDKGKGKGSGAGVGSTYANPGRPKSFQPTSKIDSGQAISPSISAKIRERITGTETMPCL